MGDEKEGGSEQKGSAITIKWGGSGAALGGAGGFTLAATLPSVAVSPVVGVVTALIGAVGLGAFGHFRAQKVRAAKVNDLETQLRQLRSDFGYRQHSASVEFSVLDRAGAKVELTKTVRFEPFVPVSQIRERRMSFDGEVTLDEFALWREHESSRTPIEAKMARAESDHFPGYCCVLTKPLEPQCIYAKELTFSVQNGFMATEEFMQFTLNPGRTTISARFHESYGDGLPKAWRSGNAKGPVAWLDHVYANAEQVPHGTMRFEEEFVIFDYSLAAPSLDDRFKLTWQNPKGKLRVAPPP